MKDPTAKEEDDQGEDDGDVAATMGGVVGDRSTVLVLRQQMADGEGGTGGVKWVELQYGNTDVTDV
jgi:hypothetical protein